ncbi:MAG: hypothetical protein A2076_00010 [Geobacteraceae bacterium GWC2_53_11]|nr:MAG: hypothetical protein A2076_00010 [Geobacteraceae bacterium GWC2_53_11]
MNRTFFVSFLFAALLSATTVFAAPLDKVQFIKVSAQDSKAVVRGADGKMQVIKPGDIVVENITVKEIIPGRIILEEKTSKGVETLIVRVDGAKTRIERLRRQPDSGPTLVAPASGTPVSK